MLNTITGLVALAMAYVFLGSYAITLKSLPLWVIIVSVLAMITFDFVQSVKRSRKLNSTNHE